MRLVCLSVALCCSVSAFGAAVRLPSDVVSMPGSKCALRVQGFAIERDASPSVIRDQFALGFDDSKSVVCVWQENGQPWYAISLDEKTVATVRAAEYEVPLRYGDFDPMRTQITVPDSLRSAPGTNVFLIQFVTQPLDEYRAILRESGITLHHYMGRGTFIATGDPASRGVARQQPFVRWMGDYHPAFKLEDEVRTNIMQSPGAKESAKYNIMMLQPGPGMKGKVAANITALGGRVEANVPDGFLIEASLTPAQIISIAQMDEVLFIDRWFPPQEYMNNVRSVGGADYVETVAGYTGQGVRAEVMDGNVLSTHQAFAAIPVLFHGSHSGTSTHGTSTYGIVFGNGAANALGRGMIPSAQGIFADYDFLTNRYTHVGQLSQSPYYAVFQTNSWGNCCSTAYTTQAADMDLNLFDHDVVLLQAQANQGTTSSDVIGFAKNVVSVGGIRHFDTANLADDSWTNAGSIGPASDGRIKPDLSFWYDSILCTTDTSTTAYTPTFGGTSAATPMTAGHFGLFFQMWSDGIFGNPVTPGASVFDNRPHMSTSKAMMINTCTPYPFSGATADLTRVHQGWGRADVRRLYDLRNKVFVVNETDALTNLQTRTYTLSVASGEPELRVTLVYTDPPGVPSSSQHRINDLTLKVTAPSGIFYYGNNGMTSANETAPGGSPNTKDTVENVWVLSPEPGNWQVQVIASEIVQDAHIETTAVDADYALVVSGIVPITPNGDLNCSGETNGDDIAAFLLGLLDANTFATTYPSCNVRYGDFDQDGLLDVADVDGFVNSLITP